MILILFSCEKEINNSGLHRGLVAYYPFDGDAKDKSTNNNHGIIRGANFTQDRFGNINSALNFDGDGDWVNCGSGNRGITNKITISLWLRTYEAQCFVISKYNTGPGFLLYINANGYLRFGGRDLENIQNGEYIVTSEPSKSINDSDWHHIVAVVNNCRWELRIDGVLEGTATSSTYLQPDISNAFYLLIGHCSIQSSMTEIYGKIDDVAIYNRILTHEEMNKIRVDGI